jgi:hypothetical protein
MVYQNPIKLACKHSADAILILVPGRMSRGKLIARNKQVLIIQ